MFYPGDFLSSPDVRIMDTLEVGAYLLLLFNSWQMDQQGFLPNDETRMRRWAQLSEEQWARSRDLLLSKWPIADDPAFRYNPRLVKEAHKQQLNREQKSLAGQRSAAQRAIQHDKFSAPAPHTSITASHSSIEHTALIPSPPVERPLNTCSTAVQREANLSSSISTSNPSTLRSEGEVPVAAAPPRARKRLDSKPTSDEVKTYAREQYPENAEAVEQAAAFTDYFDSNGWLVGGKAPMADWRASFRNWMRRGPSFQSRTGSFGSSSQPIPERAQVAPRKNADLNKWS